jgi:hypothetical protein
MTPGEYIGQPLPVWDWKNLDCCRWVDRWVQIRGHASPMQAIGMRYNSERSALRQIRKGGGLVALWSAGMEAAGVPATDMPIAGDVGVVESQTTCGTNEAAGIFTGSRWVTLGLRGFDAFPAVALRAWRV